MSERKWSELSELERTISASVLLKALQGLHQVCHDMDLENQSARPTEAKYQRAMRNAERAIATWPRSQ